MQRGPRINWQIRVSPVMVIDEAGKNLGAMEIGQALRLAQERGFDLIEVGPNTQPPVCKIARVGKWKYEQAKKARAERKGKAKQSEVKGVRITVRAATHDLAIRATQADEFLREGHMVRVEMPLRGREKAHRAFAEGKMREFLDLLITSWRMDKPIHPGGRGIEALIVREKKVRSTAPIANREKAEYGANSQKGSNLQTDGQ